MCKHYVVLLEALDGRRFMVDFNEEEWKAERVAWGVSEELEVVDLVGVTLH